MLAFRQKGFHQQLVGELTIKRRFGLAGQENTAITQVHFSIRTRRSSKHHLEPHGKILGFPANFEDFILF